MASSYLEGVAQGRLTWVHVPPSKNEAENGKKPGDASIIIDRPDKDQTNHQLGLGNFAAKIDTWFHIQAVCVPRTQCDLRGFSDKSSSELSITPAFSVQFDFTD